MPFLYDQAALSQDPDFVLRVAACAQNEIDLGDQQATYWGALHVWEVAAAPGFADAYASALAGSVPFPGRDPAVISDAQILAAVAAIGPAKP